MLRLTLSLLAERTFLLATSSKDRTQGLAKFRCRSILGIECYKHHLSSRGAWLEKSMLSRRSEFRAFTCPVLRPLIMTSSWQSAFLGTSLFPAEFHKVSVDVPQPIQRTHLPALLWIAELVSGRFPNEGGRNINGSFASRAFHHAANRLVRSKGITFYRRRSCAACLDTRPSLPPSASSSFGPIRASGRVRLFIFWH